jgi:excinuclease ABC subunit B
VFDVLVGINLLREGLDLPEVSLVAILDADKEGFLRSGTALIQTIGRAARNLNGTVVMYADRMTDSMKRAIDETNRRREKQVAYNVKHNIEPASIIKAVYDLTERLSASYMTSEQKATYRIQEGQNKMPVNEIKRLISELEGQMKQAAKDLEYERAALLRDQVYELRGIMADEANLSPWQRAKMLAGQEETA